MNPRITAQQASAAAADVVTAAGVIDTIYGGIGAAINTGAYTFTITIGVASEPIRNAITQNFELDGYTTSFEYFDDGRGYVFTLTWPQL